MRVEDSTRAKLFVAVPRERTRRFHSVTQSMNASVSRRCGLITFSLTVAKVDEGVHPSWTRYAHLLLEGVNDGTFLVDAPSYLCARGNIVADRIVHFFPPPN